MARTALETIAVIEDEGLVERSAGLGAHMRGRLEALARARLMSGISAGAG